MKRDLGPFAMATGRTRRDGGDLPVYDGAELGPYANRPGANQALQLPSRFGDQLRYRDGTVESATARDKAIAK